MHTSFHQLPTRNDEPVALELPLLISLVSDSRLFRDGLAMLLAQRLAPQSVAIDVAPSDTAHTQATHFRVVLIDASSGLVRTLELIRTCRHASPTSPIVVIELPHSVETIVDCVEAGARTYSLRGASVDMLIEELRLLQSGRVVCSPEVTTRLFQRLTMLHDAIGDPDARAFDLTEREQEVLHYIAADYSNQQIAGRLMIEVRTVKYHVHNILMKLKVRHRWEAVAQARRHGLIEQP